jgi:diaminohydroxyphosphoribosylaminopyrimidine deaminase/5-amino-6-(5-phosphoribosylamino)uracil reductase
VPHGEDASPFAAGRGIERLAAAGMAVESGVLQDEAAFLYDDYVPPKGDATLR